MCGKTVRNLALCAPLLLAAGPAVAQDQTGEAVGAGVGLLLGIIIAIVVGAIVGWLAGLIVKGSGSGFWGDVLFGIGGSLLASVVLPLIGVTLGGFIGSFLAALVGAIVLILIVRFLRRGT